MKDILIKRGALILLFLTAVSYFILLSKDTSRALNYFIIIPVILSVYTAPYFFDGKDYRTRNFHDVMLYLFLLTTFGKFIDTFNINNGLIAKIIFNIILATIILLIYHYRIKYFQSKDRLVK